MKTPNDIRRSKNAPIRAAYHAEQEAAAALAAADLAERVRVANALREAAKLCQCPLCTRWGPSTCYYADKEDTAYMLDVLDFEADPLAGVW